MIVWTVAALLQANSLAAQEVIDLSSTTRAPWRPVNRSPSVVSEDGRPILRFEELPGGGMIWNPGLELGEGSIEVDLRGRDVPQRSFLGVAFHIADDEQFEVVWLRPFNFQATDSARHAHAVQYASYPTHTWQALREKHPGMYEAPVPADLQPDQWVHLRIELRPGRVAVYLNGAATPVLDVASLDGPNQGGVGLWVGDQSNGDFASLRIRLKSDR